ncbi:hypothetical protein ACHJH3_08405 [Campylobacter sp. MOP7]|uniref:hypothetical protein n=1 Tax=Campylobacter canis TaxID=3378588 RepID=UPI00387EC59E
MGDEILMKIIKSLLIGMISINSFLFADNNQSDIKEYDRMFESINTPRKGLTESNFNSLLDPFLIQKTSRSIKSDDNNSVSANIPKLNAIFGNKVKIDGKWYKKGEQIGEYEVKIIKKSSVILNNKEQNLELNITQGKRNVDIKIK